MREVTFPLCGGSINVLSSYLVAEGERSLVSEIRHK